MQNYTKYLKGFLAFQKAEKISNLIEKYEKEGKGCRQLKVLVVFTTKA